MTGLETGGFVETPTDPSVRRLSAPRFLGFRCDSAGCAVTAVDVFGYFLVGWKFFCRSYLATWVPRLTPAVVEKR